MQYVLWTLVSIVSYISGLIVIFKITPKLLSRSFDEGMFVGMATVDIIGALLAFGGVVVTFILFNGHFAVRVFNFFLLVGILIIAVRMALYCLKPRYSGVKQYKVSRLLAGIFCLFLAAAAVSYIVLLFTPQ
jgi:hypothetical protein